MVYTIMVTKGIVYSQSAALVTGLISGNDYSCINQRRLRQRAPHGVGIDICRTEIIVGYFQ